MSQLSDPPLAAEAATDVAGEDDSTVVWPDDTAAAAVVPAEASPAAPAAGAAAVLFESVSIGDQIFRAGRLREKLSRCLFAANRAALSERDRREYRETLLDAWDISWEILRAIDRAVRAVRPAEQPGEIAHDAAFDLLASLNEYLLLSDADGVIPHVDAIAESRRLSDEICSREEHLYLALDDLGLPTATEMLDPITPQYIADLVCWCAIGARTTESQTHRQMASGLSMPLGFKNGTDGSIQTAIDAMRSSRSSHSFLGIDQEGMTSIIKTAGNPDGHLVLRGGRDGVNYHPHQTADAAAKLKAAGVPSAIMVDCSHANSGKDPARQPNVWRSILEQRAAGRTDIVGAMLESHLEFGAQSLGNDPSKLRYGVSITDACLDWEATAGLLRQA